MPPKSGFLFRVDGFPLLTTIARTTVSISQIGSVQPLVEAYSSPSTPLGWKFFRLHRRLKVAAMFLPASASVAVRSHRISPVSIAGENKKQKRTFPSMKLTWSLAVGFLLVVRLGGRSTILMYWSRIVGCFP
nr:hypothetical protein Itr_chr05CG15000 [Ipomoea trifida]